MRTAFTELIGTRYPIMQAPIGGAAGPELAASVSNAGGLGSLVIWAFPAEVASHLVRLTREATKKPFSVNIRADLAQHDHVSAALDAGADIVHFFWGDPAPYSAAMRSADARMACTVASVDEAKEALDAGAELLVAQGWEAGGHVRGSVRRDDLVPAVVEVAGSVPVLACGGVSDSRTLSAALKMGAAGAAVGTRFIAAEESRAHPVYKQAVIDAHQDDAVFVGDLFDVGWPNAPHRVLRNSTVRAWESAGRPASGSRPNADDIVATGPDGSPVPRYSPMHPMLGMDGNLEALPLYAGLGVDHVTEIVPASQIIESLVET